MIFNTSYLLDAAAYTGINLITFLAFGWDKRCARIGRRRLPEATLLRLAFFGGSVGAKIAQRHFRHKTYKQPFGTYLNAILWVQLVVVVPLMFPQTRDAIGTFLRNW